jgi:DNA-binding NarL/FixJ family response regulator
MNPEAGLLTDKQLEVLSCKARGMDMPEIARTLQISVRTARLHLKGAVQRLGVNSGIEAAAEAVRIGLIEEASDVR